MKLVIIALIILLLFGCDSFIEGSKRSLIRDISGSTLCINGVLYYSYTSGHHAFFSVAYDKNTKEIILCDE